MIDIEKGTIVAVRKYSSPGYVLVTFIDQDKDLLAVKVLAMGDYHTINTRDVLAVNQGYCMQRDKYIWRMLNAITT